jgi:conjugative relaxase-like TrwC/TraI family protein
MIFINHIKGAKAAKDYYSQHVAPGDYYTRDSAEMPPIWDGKGAKRLGLQGEVKKEDFFALCDNRDPHTGKQITPRMDDDRRVLTDVTFNAPKAVSGAYELGGDDRVYHLHVAAVKRTMALMEADAKARVRKGGANHDEVTGELTYALNTHRTARQVNGRIDFHLHTHATVLNMTYSPSARDWRAVQLGDIVRDKGYYQAVYLSHLASGMKDLGYGIVKDGKSFTLAGISRETIDKFSQRTAVIEAEAEKRRISSAAEKGALGRKTREKKSEKPQTMQELRDRWNARATQEELLDFKTARSGWERGDAAITPEQAKEYALEHSFQNASTVSEKRLQAEALTYGVGSVRPEDVADIAQHSEVIAETRAGQLMTTTKTMLNHELAFLQFAKDGQRKQKPFVSISRSDVNKPDPFVSLSGLSDEQRKAALHILNSRDTVTGIIGKAGTGKTTMMRATVDAIHGEPDQRVSVFAPSATARDVLKKEGFREAETLAMLLKNPKLQEKTKGQTLWLDEAGLVSSPDMRKLMDLAKKNGNRLILSGDYTQNSSVEAGDAFRLLEKEAGVKFARLTEVRRQTEPGYRKAVEQISQGTGRDAQRGFDALDKMDCIIEASGPERHALLVKDYLQAVNDGKSALIIAPTHSEGDKLTGELRGALKERGAIGKERDFVAWRSTNWTDAQKGDERNYEPGMVIEFNQNAKGFARAEKAVVAQKDDGLFLQKTDGTRTPLPIGYAKRFDVFRPSELKIARGDRIRITRNGEARVGGQPKGTRLNNGDIFTVEGFTKEGDIRLEKGKLLPKDWAHMSLGYVDTSYSSQGKTVDRVFIAAGNESLPATNQQQWYVSASRGREQAKLYVDTKEDVRNAIARTGQRLSAVELTRTKLRSSWQQRFYKSLSQNRVSRFLSQRANAFARQWQERGQEKVSYA